MKKVLILFGILVLFSTTAVFATSQIELIQAFVSFDQAFIPPLAITNQEKLKPSKKAMAILNQSWSQFKTAYYDYSPADPDWKKDFDYADAQIQKANEIVNSGKNLMGAHEALESVRFQFMQMRKRNQIDYYVDYLTEFHEYMEAIFHAGQDSDAESLTADDINELKNQYEEAARLWQKVSTMPFDKTLYGLSDEKFSQMKELTVKETEALNQLKEAIDAKDNPRILNAAMGIKPNYAQLYKLFGNFERIQKGSSS